jgi:hypothetical protein
MSAGNIRRVGRHVAIDWTVDIFLMEIIYKFPKKFLKKCFQFFENIFVDITKG